RSVFCELVVNNDYKGVYTLMEKIKKDENRVDIATLNPEDVTGIELTGGYILRVDWVDPDFIFGEDGWESNPVPSYPGAKPIIFQYYYPGPDEMALQQKTYIREFVTNAEKALISSTFANPDNGYQKYFDILSFVDYMFLCEISKEVDKYRFSTYFYKEKDTDGGKLFAGPAWDFDLGYGNVDYWPQGLDHTGWFYTTVEPHEWSIMFWWKRMMEDPYFRDFAKTRWEWLRQHHLDYSNLQALMDSIILHTGEARDRNYERWPILGTYVWPNYNWYGNNYEDEVYYFKDFLFRRMTWMDENFAGAVIQPQAGISSENNQILVRLYSEYFCRQDLKKDYFRLNNSPGSVHIESVTYQNASECLLTLSESVTGFPDVTVTISDKAINYWEDITSSTLASSGIGEDHQDHHDIRLFENDHSLHILCDQPEYLPETAEIFNMAGQSLLTVKLEKKDENILPHQLNPGIYLAIFNTPGGKHVLKFPVGL
ncbi:MAG: T9SS type A sorting domain-containing protein, partial [Bacteroidales bacterium]|nr:T9SS type A sorting domain-containing protein [Bacteroidales bacterium]